MMYQSRHLLDPIYKNVMILEFRSIPNMKKGVEEQVADGETTEGNVYL